MIAALYASGLIVRGNFHTVVEGEVYRSAQPTPVQLAAYRDTHGIVSVINLRGVSPDQTWYRQEVDAADQLGIRYFDFPMSASKLLRAEEARRLIALLRSVPKPVLIHCKAGADRTGLASALYVAAISQGGELAAEHQLSLTYGHVSGYFSEAKAMDETFESLEAELGFPNS